MLVVAYSLDEKRLVSGSEGDMVSIWNSETSHLLPHSTGVLVE